jgi:hypothetical protein
VTTSGSVTSYRHGDQPTIDLLASSSSSRWTAVTASILANRHEFGTAEGKIYVVTTEELYLFTP